MQPGRSRNKTKGLIISIIVTAAIILYALTGVASVDMGTLVSRLFKPLGRLLVFISIGLVIGQVIEASGWTRYLAAVAAPLFRYGNMGQQCSAAFTTAFFSGTVANAMLFDFYKEGTICKKQLYLANFVNQLPAYFLHLPTTMFIVIPLTGMAGAFYFLITFTAVVLRTILFLIYGNLMLPGTACEFKEQSDPHEASGGKKSSGGLWKNIRARFPNRIMGVATFVLPIYTLVFVLNAMGLFNALRDLLAGFVVTSVIPVESLSVVILSFVAEFSSGFAAAGALLEAGILTVKQTALALVIGNITAFPIRALRHQLPRYMGIFTPKMGGQILFMGQLFRVGSIILIAAGYYLIA